MAAAMLFDLRILPSVTVADAPRDTLPLSKLEHAVPVHDIAENPVEGNFSPFAAGLASGDFSGGAGGYFRRNGQKFAEYEVGVEHLWRRPRGRRTREVPHDADGMRRRRP